MLLVVRRSAAKARTQAANQIHSLVVTAPEGVKHQFKGMGLKARVRVCARLRPGEEQTTAAYAKKTLRHWPADTRPRTQKKPNSMTRSAVSAPRPGQGLLSLRQRCRHLPRRCELEQGV